jgi:hypothetical protein
MKDNVREETLSIISQVTVPAALAILELPSLAAGGGAHPVFILDDVEAWPCNTSEWFGGVPIGLPCATKDAAVQLFWTLLASFPSGVCLGRSGLRLRFACVVDAPEPTWTFWVQTSLGVPIPWNKAVDFGNSIRNIEDSDEALFERIFVSFFKILFSELSDLHL